MRAAIRVGALVLVASLLPLGCSDPSSSSKNDFANVKDCPDGGCLPCAGDSDCQTIVDCCGELNFCVHVQQTVKTCGYFCPEGSKAPHAACVNSRCLCQ